MADALERLADHMDKEEAFQLAISQSLKETAVSLAVVAQRLETNEKLHEITTDGIDKLDGKLDDHEKRIGSVEHSVAQAATVAKWFFGGGFVACCGSAYFLWRMVETLGLILKDVSK